MSLDPTEILSRVVSMPETGNQDGDVAALEEPGDVVEVDDPREKRGVNVPQEDVVEDLRMRTVTVMTSRREEEGRPLMTEKIVVGNVQNGERDVAPTGVARAVVEAVEVSEMWITETPDLVDGTTIGWGLTPRELQLTAVPNGSELHPVAEAGTLDPVEVEAAAVVLVVVAEAEGVAAEEVEAVAVAPTLGIVTTPSIMITTVPDRGAGEARMRVEIEVMIVEMIVETVAKIVETVAMTVETGAMTVETGAMTVGMIEMVGSLAGAREEGGPRTDPAEPTEKTPRLLPRYLCNLTS